MEIGIGESAGVRGDAACLHPNPLLRMRVLLPIRINNPFMNASCELPLSVSASPSLSVSLRVDPWLARSRLNAPRP